MKLPTDNHNANTVALHPKHEIVFNSVLVCMVSW